MAPTKRSAGPFEAAESWFRTLAETAATAIFVFREQFLYANRASEGLTGYSIDELLQMPFWEVVHPDSREAARARGLARLRGEEVPARLELVLLRADGARRWIDFTAGLIAFEDEPAVLGTAFDITDRKLAEEALHDEKERAEVTLASIGDGVIRTDSGGRIDYMNPAAERLTGHRLGASRGRLLEEVFRTLEAGSRAPARDPVTLCLRERRHVTLPGERILLHPNGEELRIRDSVSPVRDREGTVAGAVLVLTNLTEIRRLELEMARLATLDPLTGLPTRKELERRIEAASGPGPGRDTIVGILSVEHFQLVFESSGHAAADEMIRQVADVLRTRLGPEDTLSYLGGSELGLLLPGRSAAEARLVAEELRQALSGFRFSWQGRVFDTGIVVGLADLGAGRDPESQLDAAEAACAVAREGGRAPVHLYRPGDRAIAHRRGERRWLYPIHQALADGRFRLYCQRVRSLSEHPSPPLFEVLLRMRDEGGGLIDPQSFLPAAERFRLISKIDRWVIRNTLELLGSASCPAGGRCFLNISGQSLGEESFLSFVSARFGESAVPPERICFELTETSAIADLPRALRFFSEFRRLGCSFALDDFGSGLASFSYLKNLPVDFVKIDGEFVREMTTDPIQHAIVDSINEIAHAMGIRTVAESVEDEATLEELRRLGVDYAQGFWLAEPEPLTHEALDAAAS